MKSTKRIELDVWKDYDYMPLSKKEKKRVMLKISKELEELVNRFDGPAKVEVIFYAKGNC